jgi:hypothetical protein
VLDLRERFQRFSADVLSWRIGREEIRKLRFEINKLLVQRSYSRSLMMGAASW